MFHYVRLVDKHRAMGDHMFTLFASEGGTFFFCVFLCGCVCLDLYDIYYISFRIFLTCFPSELLTYSEHTSAFKEIGASVVGISTDSHHTHLAWVKTPRAQGGLEKMNFPLVADISKEISRSYGVLVEEEEDGMFGAALRGSFIIDPKGIIRSIQINDDHVGRNVDETLRLIKAFQYADKHGEVCPANWQPGGKTMAPNPAGMSITHCTHVILSCLSLLCSCGLPVPDFK